MALSLRNIVRIRYGITGSFSMRNVLSRARHDFGPGIARTPNGISLRLLLEALRVYPPGIPTQVTAVAGDAQATVFWQAPSSDGGSPIYEYNIAAWDTRKRLPITGTRTDGSARSAVVTGLTNGVPYFFRVWATNAAGDGTAKDSNIVTPATSPPPPDCGTWFYFRVDNPASDVMPCSMWAQCAIDEATAQQIIQNLNVGATVTQVDYSTYLQGCS